MLSNPDYIAWDFTSATTPLESKYGQTETWSLVGATVDTTDGLRCRTNGARADLACTNGGDLTNWAHPYTFVWIGKRTISGASAFSWPLLSNFTQDFGLYLAPNMTTTPVRFRNGSATDLTVSLNFPPDETEGVIVLEIASAQSRVWCDGTLRQTVSHAVPLPTWATTDIIRIGPSVGTQNMQTDMHGCALVQGTLTSGDLDALQADWRDALFGSAGIARSVFPFFLR